MPGVADVLTDVSLEITAADREDLGAAAVALAPGTSVAITHLSTQTGDEHLAAARAVADLGLTAIPHLAARRLSTADELASTLSAHEDQGTSERVMVVGGDPREPHGPYSEAAQVIESGLLAAHGVREVGIAGYPDGHPAIPSEELHRLLVRKLDAIAADGMDARIVTQFCFDVDVVLAWVAGVRAAGIDVPIRVGVPGPAGVRRLVSFARRCGVRSSATLARKYGFSVTSLVGSAGPDRFLEGFADGLDAGVHGDVRVHLFALGGLDAAAGWLARHPATA
ncbi:methylenetetrahydrofolate reductase [Demequina sp. NBRC 110056]|uniref:methylenetetrahydrofolate reductase n=1 Tax=Demequina sp. NBRC 110056 TaxID=1570345 RepID=UPI000A05CE03|nr:methylenetetrahydrofolate reductase [Demequina sp. NBRC 110056]